MRRTWARARARARVRVRVRVRVRIRVRHLGRPEGVEQLGQHEGGAQRRRRSRALDGR